MLLRKKKHLLAFTVVLFIITFSATSTPMLFDGSKKASNWNEIKQMAKQVVSRNNIKGCTVKKYTPPDDAPCDTVFVKKKKIFIYPKKFLKYADQLATLYHEVEHIKRGHVNPGINCSQKAKEIIQTEAKNYIDSIFNDEPPSRFTRKIKNYLIRRLTTTRCQKCEEIEADFGCIKSLFEHNFPQAAGPYYTFFFNRSRKPQYSDPENNEIYDTHPTYKDRASFIYTFLTKLKNGESPDIESFTQKYARHLSQKTPQDIEVVEEDEEGNPDELSEEERPRKRMRTK